jgi:phosphotriesterase-related protein
LKKPDLFGKVQTVLGTIDGEFLGITSTHEHIIWDMSVYFEEPESASDRELAYQPVSMENLHLIRAKPHVNIDNMVQTDERVAIYELLKFKHAGGGTLVELSQHGMARDPLALARIARATGLNIIMGSGYYVGLSHPEGMDGKTEEDIADEIVRDITVGVGNTGVKSGIIGEIGCSLPLTKNERKVLRACAIAQRRTGAPINIHPSIDDETMLENITILKEAGADLKRVAISHVDGFGYSLETRLKVLESGSYVEYDGFGQALFHFFYMGRIANAMSDIQKITDIMQLIDKGYLDQILIAQDLCFKCCLATYGGYGYAHIIKNLTPFMKAKGMTDKQIHILLVDNPRRFLEFSPVKD